MAKKSSRKSKSPDEIDVKEAIRRAAAFLTDVFADADVRDIRLEEVEYVDQQECWLVTLSFLRRIPVEESAAWERAATPDGAAKEYRREYKAVEVDGRTGKARSIKMRAPV